MFAIHKAPQAFSGLSCIEERDLLKPEKIISGSSNVSLALKVDAVLDAGIGRQALARLIERHDALRTGFSRVGEQWQRQVLQQPGQWDVCELLSEQEAGDEELAQTISDFCSQGFSLAEKCLFRVLFLRGPGAVTHVVVSMAHLVSDMATASIFLKDFSDAYALCADAAESVPAHSQIVIPSLADYAYSERQWLASDDFVQRLERLRAVHVDTCKGLDSPANKLGIKKMTSRPVFCRFGVFPAQAEAGIMAATGRLRVSLPLFLMAVGGLAISRAFDLQKSVFTIQFAGRQFPGGDKMLGHFNVPLRLLIDVSDYTEPAAFIKSVSRSWFQLLSQFAFIPTLEMDEAVVPSAYRKLVPGTLGSSAINLMPPASEQRQFAGFSCAPCPTKRLKVAGNICQLYFFFLDGKINYRAISTENEANLDQLCAAFNSLVTQIVAQVLAEAERAA